MRFQHLASCLAPWPLYCAATSPADADSSRSRRCSVCGYVALTPVVWRHRCKQTHPRWGRGSAREDETEAWAATTAALLSQPRAAEPHSFGPSRTLSRGRLSHAVFVPANVAHPSPGVFCRPAGRRLSRIVSISVARLLWPAKKGKPPRQSAPAKREKRASGAREIDKCLLEMELRQNRLVRFCTGLHVPARSCTFLHDLTRPRPASGRSPKRHKRPRRAGGNHRSVVWTKGPFAALSCCANRGRRRCGRGRPSRCLQRCPSRNSASTSARPTSLGVIMPPKRSDAPSIEQRKCLPIL